MNIIEKIEKIIIKRKLKKLGKVSVVLKNDEYTRYLEEGEKTYARFAVYDTVNLAMKYVFGKNTNRIHNVSINEDEDRFEIILLTSVPGLLIGRNGNTIESCTNLLKKTFKKDVIFDLNEYKYRTFYGVRRINMY